MMKGFVLVFLFVGLSQCLEKKDNWEFFKVETEEDSEDHHGHPHHHHPEDHHFPTGHYNHEYYINYPDKHSAKYHVHHKVSERDGLHDHQLGYVHNDNHDTHHGHVHTPSHEHQQNSTTINESEVTRDHHGVHIKGKNYTSNSYLSHPDGHSHGLHKHETSNSKEWEEHKHTGLDDGYHHTQTVVVRNSRPTSAAIVSVPHVHVTGGTHTHPYPYTVHDHERSKPGYPSSDYVRYFSKYTSSGGNPSSGPHSYYRYKHGRLANYNVEPENSQPRSRLVSHLRHADSSISETRVDPNESERNYVAAGKGYYQSASTGPVNSPSGPGPHHGYVFTKDDGTDNYKGKILVGNTPIHF